MVFAINWHESAMDLHVFLIPIPPLTFLSIPSLWVFPVHQLWALVSCIQPGWWSVSPLIVYLFQCYSLNIPPSPSPREFKSLFCTSVSQDRHFEIPVLNLGKIQTGGSSVCMQWERCRTQPPPLHNPLRFSPCTSIFPFKNCHGWAESSGLISEHETPFSPACFSD